MTKHDRAGDRVEAAKGRVKQAAGTLTGSKKMEHQGKADRASAKTKGVVHKLTDKVEKGIDRLLQLFHVHSN